MARCCPCKGEGARCVRYICVKKKQLCSSCHAISTGKCCNLNGADSGAGPSSMSGPALRPSVSTCMPVSSLTQFNCSSSVDVGTDGGGDGGGDVGDDGGGLTSGSSRNDVL